MITFNGVYLGAWLDVHAIRGRGFLPPQNVVKMNIPGKPGTYHIKNEDEDRVIENDVSLIENDLASLRAKIRDIAPILYTRTRVPIVYDDEPDKAYYGIVSGSTDIEQIVSYGEGTITFECEPYAYGAETSLSFSNDEAILNVDGTTNTFPRLEATFTAAEIEFKITHEQTRKSVRLTRNFEIGDRLEIDFARGLVIVNDERAITSLDIVTSDFFMLNPGAQTLTITPNAIAEASIYWKPRWI